MKKEFWGFTALGFMLTAVLLAAVPAGAQSVDDKIKALEQELGQLKSQQIELKKESTAAAAALPSFSYRPGNGLDITAADKSWGIRFSMETNLRMMFESGQDAVGRTNGEIMLRRWRPMFFYCIDNCLYEIETSIDLDGFGTGNAKNSTNTGGSSILQRGVVHFHLENLNPFLPTVDIGGDISTSLSLSRQGSSAVGTQLEYDLLSRNVGPNTGRAGWGIVMNWDDRSLSGIGIPGRIGRYQFAMASVGEGDDNLSSFTDRKDFNTYISVFPFSQLKNKWIQGLMFEFGAWFCNVDQRASSPNSAVDNGCDRLRIQDNGDAGRQTLFDTGADSRGEGLFTFFMPGVTWSVGPYRLRAVGGFAQDHDGNFKPGPSPNLAGKKRGRDFLIGHDLFLWSPKGWLTGSVNTPGSIYVGTSFQRTDVSCDVPRCPTTGSGIGTLAQFHRGTYIIREWDLWYFLAPRMSIGGGIQWYNASNLTTTVQRNLGVRHNGRVGGGGEWLTGNINYRYQF